MKLSRRGVIQGAAAVGSLWALGCASSSKSGAGGTDADTGAQGQAAKVPPPSKPQNILILGGTQFLGPALVEFARSRGHTVTLFTLLQRLSRL